jgi:hypothetical protein
MRPIFAAIVVAVGAWPTLLVGGDSWLKAGGLFVALARLAIGAIMVIRRGRLRAAPRARHRSARWRGAPRDMRIMEPATTSHAMTVVVQEVEAGGAAPPTKPMATSRGAGTPTPTAAPHCADRSSATHLTVCRGVSFILLRLNPSDRPQRGSVGAGGCLRWKGRFPVG